MVRENTHKKRLFHNLFTQATSKKSANNGTTILSSSGFWQLPEAEGQVSPWREKENWNIGKTKRGRTKLKSKEVEIPPQTKARARGRKSSLSKISADLTKSKRRGKRDKDSWGKEAGGRGGRRAGWKKRNPRKNACYLSSSESGGKNNERGEKIEKDEDPLDEQGKTRLGGGHIKKKPAQGKKT